MSNLNKISLLTTSMLQYSVPKEISSFLAVLGLPSLIWGAFNCYFGFKIFKFILALNCGFMVAFVGIILGLILESSSVVVIGAILGFILGVHYGFKFYKFMVSINFSFTVGAIFGGISAVVTESMETGMFILIIVSIATYFVVYKIYDILAILYTAISGALSIGIGLTLASQSIELGIISVLFCSITGFMFQSSALKKNPQNAPYIPPVAHTPPIQNATNPTSSSGQYTPPSSSSGQQVPPKPIISPEMQGKIDDLFKNFKATVLVLLSKKIEIPPNLMYYFLAGSVLSLVSLLMAFSQGVTTLTKMTNLTLALTICLVFGRYVTTKISDVALNGALYSLIFFSALNVFNFTSKGSYLLNNNTSLWLLLFVYFASILTFGILLLLNLTNTKKDERLTAILGAVIGLSSIFLWVKGYKLYSLTSISMLAPLITYLHIPELLIRAKSELDKAQSNAQKNNDSQ